MTFPTIPTGTQIVSTVQQNTTATRTIDLTGLTKNSGDLLIAIFVGYNTSTGTNAAFSGWTSGWTEFHDTATNGTLPIGMAYKWSAGNETTLSATQAATITGHCAMLVMAIPGAHGSTPPEAGSRASQPAGATLPDPAAFNPTGWDAEDTLWIAVGAEGESSTTGSWTGLGATPPTNYSGMARSTIADVLNSTQVGVCFRQLNAASEDVGTWGADTSNSLHAAVVIAVRPLAQVTASRATTWNTTAQVAPATRASTWNVYVTAADSPGLELSSFGTFSGINNGDTINWVRVAIVHKETSGAQAPTYQLWDGTSAQIGTTQTGTTGTSDHTDSHDFTGVTYSQLATLRVRVYGHAQTTLVESVDSVALTVNYTAQSTTQVTASKATTWATHARVTGTRATTWNVNETLTQVSASRATSWVTRMQATATRQTTWNVAGSLTQVTASRATTWTVGYAYSSSPADNVGITDQVTVWLDRVRTIPDSVGITDTGIDQSLDYAPTLNDPVGITDQVTVSMQITATRSTTWNVAGALTQVTATRATTWVTRLRATGTRATTWVTRDEVTSTRATSWVTRFRATASRATTWNVAGTLAQVSSTRATTWTTRARVTGNRQTTWNALARVTPTTRATTWTVRTPVAPSGRATTWKVAARATGSRATTWTTRSRATASRAATWSVLTPVTPATRATTWAVLVQIAAASRASTWSTYAQATGSRATFWDVRIIEATVLLEVALGPYRRVSSATMRTKATAVGPYERLASP